LIISHSIKRTQNELATGLVTVPSSGGRLWPLRCARGKTLETRRPPLVQPFDAIPSLWRYNVSHEEENLFDPNEMAERVERMKREGTFPSPEQFVQALEKVRLKYQKRVEEVRSRNKKGEYSPK
jgi:hypothetical protein